MPKPSRWSGPAEQVELVGLEAIDSKLNLVLDHVKDLRPAWEEFYRPAFYMAEKGWFSTEGEGSWPAQNRQYAKWKSAHGGGSELMVLTGALRSSLTRKGAKWSTARLNHRVFEIGTKDPVANLHVGKRARTRRIAVAGPESDILKATMTDASQKFVQSFGKEWGKNGV